MCRLDRIHGQRQAVERNRAFRRDEAGERGGARSASRAISGKDFAGNDLGKAVTWPVTRWPPSSSPILSERSD